MNNVSYRLLCALLVSAIASAVNLGALAQSEDIQVKSGHGEEFNVKHRLFGRKNIVVQDRLGDKFLEIKLKLRRRGSAWVGARQP